MTVLGIETATLVCGAAVAADGRVVAEESLAERAVHAEKLFSLIDAVCVRAGCAVAGLDGVAVSAGPGSFTGLRIGLSAAKGLVFASGRPLVAVPTLEALALRAADDATAQGCDEILAVLDARRDEVYWQRFAPAAEGILPIGEARDASVGAVVAEAAGRRVLVTGDGAHKLALRLASAGEEVASRFRLLTGERSHCSAGSVALLGSSMLDRGIADDPATLEPRYIKEFFLKTR